MIQNVHSARTESPLEHRVSHLAIFEPFSAEGHAMLTVQEFDADTNEKTKASIFLSPQQWAELAQAAAKQAARATREPVAGDKFLTNGEVVARAEERARVMGHPWQHLEG